MSNFLYEFVPILLFFLVFKFYDIYAATIVGIAATGLQVIIQRVWKGYFENKQVITFLVFLFFGSMTLYFHNPIFVKWKPTIIFWVFAVVLLVNKLISKRPLLQRMFEGTPQFQNVIPAMVWNRLSYAWMSFFLVMGGINLYIAYFYSDNTWVNFKFYGILGLVFLFSVGQAVYLSRFISEQK